MTDGRYLNLGCGQQYHPDWINLDIVPRGPDVLVHDLRDGIPFPDESCHVVYHSHVLEHMRKSDALPFMRECYRVLEPHGILRVATPDLEQICRLYLETLEAVIMNGNDEVKAHDYDWMMLELYDQTVREESGGDMAAYLRRNPVPNEQFVYARIGEEGRALVKSLKEQKSSVPKPGAMFRRLRKMGSRGILNQFKRLCGKLVTVTLLGQDQRRSLDIGRFRMDGEVHHWLYDRYSLARLMLSVGFSDPIQQSASTSRIPPWSRFHLDTLLDGTVRKPDSLFMEAIKKD